MPNCHLGLIPLCDSLPLLTTAPGDAAAQGCGVDTSLPPGSLLTVQFAVFDLFAGTLAAVNRTIIILSPCPEGQQLCAGSCSSVNCALRSELPLTGPPTPHPPPLSPHPNPALSSHVVPPPLPTVTQ